MPPENIQNPIISSDKPTKGKSIILLVAVFIALILIMYFLMRSPTTITSPVEVNSNVVTSQTDIANALTPEDRLPQGFPSDIPVDTAEMIESYSAEYKDIGATQYTVMYASSRPMEELYAQYLSFMTDAGYEFGDNGKNEEQKELIGTKDNDNLIVKVSTREGRVFVQISFLDRD